LEQSNRALQENARLQEEIKELKGWQTAPKIERIAGLDDKFQIKCRRRTYRNNFIYSNGTFSVTWRQIFIAVAGFLEKSKTDAIILSSVKELAKETNAHFESYDMNQTDEITIKVQLEALGLILTGVSRTNQGGIAEFLSLAFAGKQQFIQERVVRKVQPDHSEVDRSASRPWQL
jgi:hypothetical protein